MNDSHRSNNQGGRGPRQTTDRRDRPAGRDRDKGRDRDQAPERHDVRDRDNGRVRDSHRDRKSQRSRSRERKRPRDRSRSQERRQRDRDFDHPRGPKDHDRGRGKPGRNQQHRDRSRDRNPRDRDSERGKQGSRRSASPRSPSRTLPTRPRHDRETQEPLPTRPSKHPSRNRGSPPPREVEARGARAGQRQDDDESGQDHYRNETTEMNMDDDRSSGEYGDANGYDDDDPAEEDGEDMDAMQAMMGFGGFGTTKGRKIAGNDVGGVRKEKKNEYRQYMNRHGGFNRPLSPSGQGP